MRAELVPPFESAINRSRLASIDWIRGAVMIIMAIDHVRVFAALPAGGASPGIFFTRWITNFCAPVFVFLAGSSAYLYGCKHKDLSRFLLIRGLWLVILELTFFRLAWTFNVDYAHYLLAGVIWVIGWSMIILAVLVKLPVPVVGLIGVVVMAGHNVTDPHLGALVSSIEERSFSWFWKLLYLGFLAGPIRFGADGPDFWVLYSLVPWFAVMGAGYAFGKVLVLEPARRNRICLAIGLGAIALFLILRGFNLYGDPNPWVKLPPQNGAPAMPALFAFLNPAKYPASLLFLLMTLGPAIGLIPVLESARGRVANWIAVFGRVPFFYYLLHIPLIHALALIVSKLRLGEVTPWLFANHPMGQPRPPEGYMWSLPLLYLVWAFVVLMLYFPCRWFAELKTRSNDSWLKYF